MPRAGADGERGMSYQPAPYTNWNDLLAHLTPGLYVTVHGGGTMGDLIRTFTHAPVAHVVVYVGMQPDGHDAMEATPDGVRACNLRLSYDAKSAYPAKDKITAEQSAKMVAAALAAKGKPYGWLADVLIGMREGFHLWVPDWAFKLKAVTTEAECAQFADWVGMQGGVHFFDDGRQPGSISPADLWRRDYH
jgi:hypothetical protein